MKAKVEDKVVTHIASEKVLAKNWLTPEEDLAWQSLEDSQLTVMAYPFVATSFAKE